MFIHLIRIVDEFYGVVRAFIKYVNKAVVMKQGV